MNCEVVLLHDKISLLEDCCRLLNTEWKRSHGVSLVLLVDGSVSGHVRLSRVVDDEKSLFLTSVIIDPDMRGKGFGKKLLFLTEKYALSRGYTSLCLSSDGSEKFYKRCGFFTCQPVQQCQNKVLDHKLSILQRKLPDQAKTEPKNLLSPSRNVSTDFSELLSSVPVPSSSVPPPPPPPPPVVSPLLDPANSQSIASKIWMRKNLIPKEAEIQ